MENEFGEEIVKEFMADALELFDEAEDSLLKVDRGESFQDHYNIIFRAFHSAKGGAGMFGLDCAGAIVHQLENKLLELKENDALSKDQVSYFLNGLDLTRKALQGEPVDISELETQPKKQKERAMTEESAPVTIYHVDDQQTILSIISKMLKAHGYAVSSFTCARELFKAFKEEPCDIVLSDYQMPEFDGLDVIKEIERINADTPVILFTGALTKELCLEAIELGAFAMLEKPADESALITTLENAKRISESTKIVNQSINLLLYQFSDLKDFLLKQEKSVIYETISYELNNILKSREDLRKTRRRTG